ncbi:IspD/TarI family cytidylyltransferase [Mycoplasmoides gallisepticum]|uniref:IspD/TarI family cytidylyltransferase n=1 Tax=Mycoplasmoides gallisepticum TaxID=2096 RepID=UPI001245417E|nr:IspD/TarI family cytidylyltransferase [Mycoplasmoides gallisepticum]QEX45777.1 2-C-methyl-D-erythritol 4-phosphate cytidylyltransferase [Mycoplasmoides gallisepticum]
MITVKMITKTVGIILASGSSSRIGLTDQLKQFYLVNNKMVYEYSLDQFLASNLFDLIYLVVNEQHLEMIKAKHSDNHIIKVIVGSKINRHLSFIHAINDLIACGYDDQTKIVVHDSARPNINQTILSDCLNALDHYQCVSLYQDIASSLIKIDQINQSQEHLDRDQIKMIYTPQATWLKTVKDLVDDQQNHLDLTDFLLKLKGVKAHWIKTKIDCFKITTLADLEHFKLLVNNRKDE